MEENGLIDYSMFFRLCSLLHVYFFTLHLYVLPFLLAFLLVSFAALNLYLLSSLGTENPSIRDRCWRVLPWTKTYYNAQKNWLQHLLRRRSTWRCRLAESNAAAAGAEGSTNHQHCHLHPEVSWGVFSSSLFSGCTILTCETNLW